MCSCRGHWRGSAHGHHDTCYLLRWSTSHIFLQHFENISTSHHLEWGGQGNDGDDGDDDDDDEDEDGDDDDDDDGGGGDDDEEETETSSGHGQTMACGRNIGTS